MSNRLSGQAAIVGIGATEFSKESGRSELQLSVEAIGHALADAGLAASDVDGLVTFTMDTSAEIAVARELGMGDLRFFSRINFGGGAACGTLQQAAMAVATGSGWQADQEKPYDNNDFDARKRAAGEYLHP